MIQKIIVAINGRKNVAKIQNIKCRRDAKHKMSQKYKKNITKIQKKNITKILNMECLKKIQHIKLAKLDDTETLKNAGKKSAKVVDSNPYILLSSIFRLEFCLCLPNQQPSPLPKIESKIPASAHEMIMNSIDTIMSSSRVAGLPPHQSLFIPSLLIYVTVAVASANISNLTCWKKWSTLRKQV